MIYDCIIIGGGASGVSCALVLGSAMGKPFMEGKKIAIIPHQKNSMLQNAEYNNVYGVAPGTLGAQLLESSLQHLQNQFPDITHLPQEKVTAIVKTDHGFQLTFGENHINTKIVVLAINSGSPWIIDGFLEDYVIPHQKSAPEKNRIQLKNTDHKVCDNVYVVGNLAGHRNQLAIAAGSGAAVAADLLTLWNGGIHTQAHDSVKK